jgi:hypothetical protein
LAAVGGVPNLLVPDNTKVAIMVQTAADGRVWGFADLDHQREQWKVARWLEAKCILG